MKKIYLFLWFLFSINCNASSTNKEGEVNLALLEKFLTNLYTEIKCPTYPFVVYEKLGISICIHSLNYNIGKKKVLFAYTVYDNNEAFKDFQKNDFNQRKAIMFEMLTKLARYTGILPVAKGAPLYGGKIQTTIITFAYTPESIKKQTVIWDYVQKNGVIGLRFVDPTNVTMRYIAYLDTNRKYQYKEGIMASILDFDNWDHSK